eukprot:CCRYP_013454-RA/>CCRYP_013454-RA protein AED:0.36 eAED:0.39 QI:0/0/0/1/0/0/4/0/743
MILSSLTRLVARNRSTQNASCHPRKLSEITLPHPGSGSSTPSSMSMNSQASNKPSGISMPPPVFPPKEHGWQPFDMGTTTPGHSWKKRSKDTCVASAKACAPLRQLFTPILSHSHLLPHHTHSMTSISKLYSDQTGKFPHASSRGNRYQMILYHTDSNSIWVEPTKNRTEGELILARTRALSRMQACRLTPQHQVLDNEASAAYKQAILDSGLTYQLVPPDDHRCNVAEKAIQTCKDHFIAVLIGTDNKFPLHLWCQLIPHMERQLNLLRQSNANPKVSAYAHLYGPHNYNALPFVPLSMEALVHDKPIRCKTYAQHCSTGWVIGTSTPPLAPRALPQHHVRSLTYETMLHALSTHHNGITASQATQRRYPTDMLNAVLNDETGELMEYRHLVSNPKYRDTWKNAYGKELGRLAQGLPGIVKGTNTIVFILKTNVPQDRWKDVTYRRIVANFRPEKDDRYRIRLSVCGNRINFPGDCGTPTADMITFKVLLNSVISTKNARIMTIDIKDFYLNTPMDRPEFMRLKLSDIPDNIIDLYKLCDIAHDGYVFVRIKKGMHGLPQAGIIAQQLLEQHLQANGYHQSKINPGFWTHDWRPICFALCVDDFGVKYVGKEHADHLIQTLRGHYEISMDWNGQRYIGLTLHWDYRNRLVRLSMPGYCEKAGQRFQHSKPNKPQHQPYPSAPRTYGTKQQLCASADTSPALGKQQKTFIQEVIGVFLYYARAVDCTILTALGSLATQQANPT